MPTSTSEDSPHPRRYLAFEADLAGFNNILMQFEIIVTLAWLTKRTLILPPPSPIYLLGQEPRTFGDFFDLDVLRKYVDVIPAAEFDPSLITAEAFRKHMTAVGHSPGWNALQDVFLWPASALTDRLELISRLYGRRPVGIGPAERDCGILYFPSTAKHRMFGVFELFYFFADPELERRTRALVRDAIPYRRELWELVERSLAHGPLAGQDFSAMHIRRGDFHQFQQTQIEADRILRHVEHLLEPGQTLYLATDEEDPAFLAPLADRYRLILYGDLPADIRADTPEHWVGILETLICATAPQRFIGTRLSTFSARIVTVRGHLSYGAGPHAGIDTAIYYTQPPIWDDKHQQPYGVPRAKHRDEFGETSRPWWESIQREPIWARAYETVWADTGDAPKRAEENDGG